MLEAYRPLDTFAAEGKVSLLAEKEAVRREICLGDILASVPGAHPAAARTFEVIIHTHKYASLVASSDIAPKPVNIDVDHVVDHRVVHSFGGEGKIGEKPESDISVGEGDIKLLAGHHFYVFLQLLCGVAEGLCVFCYPYFHILTYIFARDGTALKHAPSAMGLFCSVDHCVDLFCQGCEASLDYTLFGC